MLILDDILLAPVKGVILLGMKIHDLINKELTDVDRLKERLMKLQLQFELDEINEEEFQRQETELLARLDAIQEEKEGK